MNFFNHKDLGNHLLQLCPKVVEHPVCIYIYVYRLRELKRNREYRLLVCILILTYRAKHVHTAEKNTVLSVTCIEDRPSRKHKNRCMYISGDQNAEQNYNIKTDNKSFENVATILTNHIGINKLVKTDEIKGMPLIIRVKHLFVFPFAKQEMSTQCIELIILTFLTIRMNTAHYTLIILFSILSDDRSRAASKTIPPHSAIQSLLFQMTVSSPVLKVIQ